MLDQAKVDRALVNVARNGDTETVKLLLEAGADVHAQDDFALRMAALRGRTGTVNLLLEAGADPNIVAHLQSLIQNH